MRLNMTARSVLHALQLPTPKGVPGTHVRRHIDDAHELLWDTNKRIRVMFTDLSVDGLKIIPLQPLEVTTQHNSVVRGSVMVSSNSAKVIVGNSYYTLDMKFMVDMVSGNTKTECQLYDSQGKLAYQDAEWDGHKQHEARVTNSSLRH